jgi:ADP-ribosylglycohydrolase
VEKKSHRTTLTSRAQGALIGLLVGDALGSGVDGWTPDRIRETYPDGVRQMHANPDLQTIPGQITDKSEPALVLARVLVEHHEYIAPVATGEYTKWLNSGIQARDEAVTAALIDHSTIENNSNAALLRAAPLGIFGARIWPGVVELWANEDAMITHSGAVCLAASELFAVAIATAVREPVAPRALFESITDYARDIVVMNDVIRRARLSPPANYLERPDIVTVALHNALWQLTHVPSFEEALVHTIAHGGDTAGNAAVCGALLGATYGIQAIPRKWVKAVIDCKPEAGGKGVGRARPHEYWPADALELAYKLVAERAEVATTKESSA